MGQPLAIVTSPSTHGPAASYCDVTMIHYSHGYLWTHDTQVKGIAINCEALELFGTWLHHFAYRGWMIHCSLWHPGRNIFVYFFLHFRTPVFQHGASLVYILITKNIRYLLWDRGFWRSLNNTCPIFLTPCIRCTNYLCYSCNLTDVNPHFIPSLLRMMQNIDLLWRHRTRADRQQLWRHNYRLFPRGCYGRFLNNCLASDVMIDWPSATLTGVAPVNVVNYHKCINGKKLIHLW